MKYYFYSTMENFIFSRINLSSSTAEENIIFLLSLLEPLDVSSIPLALKIFLLISEWANVYSHSILTTYSLPLSFSIPLQIH